MRQRTAWSEAWAGTIADLVLLGAVAHGVAAEGPRSLREEYRRQVRATLGEPRCPVAENPVTEADVTVLPEPVADDVRRSGAVGLPHVRWFRARIHGRIRGGPDGSWMRFTGEQVNTYGAAPSRVFRLDATMRGLPVDVAGLVDAPVEWEVLDQQHVRATLTIGAHRISAELVLDDRHDLVDFVSDDRLRASPDGTTFTRQRWSTPLSRRAEVRGRRLCTHGEARWHAPAPEGTFSYLELEVDDLDCGVAAREPVRSSGA